MGDLTDYECGLQDGLAKAAKLRDALAASREYIDTVRRNHWPHSIPAANIIHDIDAALEQ